MQSLALQECHFIANILVGSGFEPRIEEKFNWGPIVRFEHEGVPLFTHTANELTKKLEVFKYREEYSCWGFHDELELTEGWQVLSAEEAEKMYAEYM